MPHSSQIHLGLPYLGSGSQSLFMWQKTEQDVDMPPPPAFSPIRTHQVRGRLWRNLEPDGNSSDERVIALPNSSAGSFPISSENHRFLLAGPHSKKHPLLLQEVLPYKWSHLKALLPQHTHTHHQHHQPPSLFQCGITSSNLVLANISPSCRFTSFHLEQKLAVSEAAMTDVSRKRGLIGKKRHFVLFDSLRAPERQASLMGFRTRSRPPLSILFKFPSAAHSPGRTALQPGLAGTPVCAGHDPKGLPCF